MTTPAVQAACAKLQHLSEGGYTCPHHPSCAEQLSVKNAAAIINSDQDFHGEIKRRAKMYTEDNYRRPTQYHYLLTENAMRIGALIAMEWELKKGTTE